MIVLPTQAVAVLVIGLSFGLSSHLGVILNENGPTKSLLRSAEASNYASYGACRRFFVETG